jgi:polar amino acid transport system permease protein
MIWDTGFALRSIPYLLLGFETTLLVTLAGSALALALGLSFALAVRSRYRPLRLATSGFVEFVRRTPLLVQLYFIFFVLPDFGILLSPLASGILGLGLHAAAYMAQVYRAGIEGVERGQWEAARALNYSVPQAWRYIVLPQAIPPMIPALGNYIVLMLKESAILSIITVPEAMTAARDIGNETYRYLEPMTMVGILYWLITWPLAWVLRQLERRFGSSFGSV